MDKKIYLDFNASTPLDEDVLQAMEPFTRNLVGNPSSQHWAGEPYKAALTKARQQVAELLNCNEDEVVFTSGGSESNNLAIKGVFFSQMGQGRHIITTKIEHPSVVNPCEYLRRFGAEITYLSVDSKGKIDLNDFERAITRETSLVSIMHANNEIGTIQPLKEISEIARSRSIPFHTDAAQSVGKIPVAVDSLGVDLLTLAGHKFYAPKGIGALYIRRGIKIVPLIHGAGHEHGMRAGTEPVFLCVGLGKACELAQDLSEMKRVRDLTSLLRKRLSDHFKNEVVFNGHEEDSLPNTLSVSFVDKLGSDILSRLPDLAASTGSACHSGVQRMSSTLLAIGLKSNIGMGTIRFSLGKTTTKSEILEVADALCSVL